MANLGMNYDPNSVEPDTGRPEPVPDGRYVLHVIESDVVPTSTGNGTILKTTIEVFDGPLKGRKLFENFNIQHSNPQAQEIGQKQLSALCKAAGISSSISDSQELHYHPFEADVGTEPERTDKNGKTYAPRNAVKKYHFEAAPPAAKARVATPAPAARPAPSAGRPWQRTATA